MDSFLDKIDDSRRESKDYEEGQDGEANEILKEQALLKKKEEERLL
jgi:hypothetical protein